jgi:membrane protein insertase Oxa1/YidC/SpoIIIJ
MNPWTALVQLIERALHGVAGLLGGNLALGVFTLVLAARLALVPILLPLARRTKDWRAVYRTIKPEVKALQKEHRDDPMRMQKELQALHARHGIRVLDTAGLLLALIQVPVLIAFFQAVLHVSTDTPLASGGLLYGVVAGALSYAGTVLGDATTAKPLLVMAGVLPVLIASWLGSGVGLYLVAFYFGTLVQSLLVSRGAPATADG